MQTFAVKIDGVTFDIVRDVDGAFLIPDQLRGLGTALKPAMELCVLARKPLSEATVAANVLKWGTGAINVDGCRIDAEAGRSWRQPKGQGVVFSSSLRNEIEDRSHLGRWPANVTHDGSEEVLEGFPQTTSGLLATHHSRGNKTKSVYGKYSHNEQMQNFGGDSGSAARFFYCAKAPANERGGSKHPTVKPLALMRWLVRMVTPPGGLVLDPFAGSGSTGEAALSEGFRAVLIEHEHEYVVDIERRLERARKAQGVSLDELMA